MIYEVRKEFQGGSWIMYARLPNGTKLTEGQIRDQLETWGEGTNGGHCYGYRMYIKRVRKAPEGAKWLEFEESLLPSGWKNTAGKAKANPSVLPKVLAPACDAGGAASVAPAGSGSGMLPTLFAPSSSTREAVASDARSILKSFQGPVKSGSCRRRSGQAVALRETQLAPGLPSLSVNADTVKALLGILMGFTGEWTMSSDRFALSVMAGEKMALQAGVPPKELERVIKAVRAQYELRRSSFSKGFFG